MNLKNRKLEHNQIIYKRKKYNDIIYECIELIFINNMNNIQLVSYLSTKYNKILTDNKKISQFLNIIILYKEYIYNSAHYYLPTISKNKSTTFEYLIKNSVKILKSFNFVNSKLEPIYHQDEINIYLSQHCFDYRTKYLYLLDENEKPNCTEKELSFLNKINDSHLIWHNKARSILLKIVIKSKYDNDIEKNKLRLKYINDNMGNYTKYSREFIEKLLLSDEIPVNNNFIKFMKTINKLNKTNLNNKRYYIKYQ